MIKFDILMYNKIRLWLAIKVKHLRPCLLTKEEQEKLTLIELRRNALFFGFDFSNFSDDEIKESADKMGKALSKVGLTAIEASQLIIKLSVPEPAKVSN